MAKRWRCFFCDEVFTTRREAFLHFGDGDGCISDVAACVDPMRSDEKARMKALREAEEHALNMQREREATDERAGEVEISWAEIRKTFGDDCTTIWQVCDRYKNALNRISDLELAQITR